MDGGGRLDQPLKWSGPSTAEEIGAPLDAPRHARVRTGRRGVHMQLSAWLLAWPNEWLSMHARKAGRWATRFLRLPPPRGVGIAASLLLLAAAGGYGVVKGQHVPALIDWAKDTRDAAANSLGFRIAAIALSGEKEVSREEILTTAGVTGRASLLFLDADAARTHLLTNPWIADAAVLKLYPDRLQITITERQAFALWQKDGRISVIADDGTVLEPFVERRYVRLPFVVGRGADRQAKNFLASLDHYPGIRSVVRASVLVAQRRWNLRLTNGIDVQLPETDVEPALDRLVALDRDKKLLSRDITMIDLRLPDRVTVRLSDVAAQARNEALKDAKKKKKGGDA
jgi:cell division protein FtsQ